jgi:hypothetical protein
MSKEVYASMHDRILVVVNERFGSQRKFAVALGKTPQAINKIVKKGVIGVQFLSELVEAVPDLNMNWLITGKGERYIDTGEPNSELYRRGLLSFSGEEKTMMQKMQHEQTYMLEQIEILKSQIDKFKTDIEA